MSKVWLVHWNAAEAAPKVARLRDAGFDAAHMLPQGSTPLRRALREDPPAAIVIDLGRLPTQGRDVGLWVRQAKSTRHIPVLFVGGEPEKVAAVRAALPDAVYAPWAEVERALRRVLASPPEVTVVPRSIFDVYAGTPLVKKLGMRPDSQVLLVDPPPDFEQALGDLPAGVRLSLDPAGRPDLVIWFARSAEGLDAGLKRLLPLTEGADLWIAWPKQASGLKRGLTQPGVRRAGLALGLVDFKIVSVDATWSALRFTRRKPAARRVE